ncbi:MAG: hypothetical protein KF745_08930 [Phycisphaeraceae bacterium]|nr:hypothetical protein [Phycisphaeraceae bacterium]
MATLVIATLVLAAPQSSATTPPLVAASAPAPTSRWLAPELLEPAGLNGDDGASVQPATQAPAEPPVLSRPDSDLPAEFAFAICTGRAITLLHTGVDTSVWTQVTSSAGLTARPLHASVVWQYASAADASGQPGGAFTLVPAPGAAAALGAAMLLGAARRRRDHHAA